MASLIAISQLSPLTATTALGLPAGTDTNSAQTSTLGSAPADEATNVELITESSHDYGINTRLALDIAYCESKTKQFESNGTLVRGKVTPQDVGIFQINEGYHLKRSRELGFDIYTTRGNIEYAMWLLKNEGTQHWNSSRYCWANGNA